MRAGRRGAVKLYWLVLLILAVNLSAKGAQAFKIRSSRISTKNSHHEELSTEESTEAIDDNADDNDEDLELPVFKKPEKPAAVFTKVRKANYDLAKLRQRLGDNSKTGDRGGTVVKSVLSWFGKQSTTSDDDDDEKVIEPPAPKQVVEKTKITVDNGKPKKGRKGWRGFVEKLPLGFLRDFVSEGQSKEDDDDNEQPLASLSKLLKPTAQIVEDVMKSVKEKAQQKAQKKRTTKPTPPMPHEEFERLLMNIPSFVPNYTRIHNFECKMEGEIFLRQLKGQKQWTLAMIDSSAKITSGLMRGNMNQLGDFDMCTSIATKVKVTQKDSVNIRGKYCLSHIDVTAFEDGLKGPLHLIQGKSLVKSSLDDVSTQLSF